MSSLPKVCKRPKSQPRGWELLLRLPRSGQLPAWPNPAAGGVGWVGTECVGAAGGCWDGLVSSEGPVGAWGHPAPLLQPQEGRAGAVDLVQKLLGLQKEPTLSPSLQARWQQERSEVPLGAEPRGAWGMWASFAQSFSLSLLLC